MIMDFMNTQKTHIPTSKCFLIVITVLLCIFTTSTPVGFMVGNMNLEIIMILSSLLLTTRRYFYFKFNDLLLLLFVTIAMIQFTISSDKGLNWMRFILLFYLLRNSIIYLTNRGYNIIHIVYKTLFYTLSASSLIYIVVEIIKIPIPYVAYNSGWMHVYNLFLGGLYTNVSEISGGSQVIELLGFSFKRNYGMFTEPGLFAVFLDIILFIRLFILNKNKISELIWVLLMLLSTYSTTGIIVAVILLAYYSYINFKHYFKLFYIGICPFFLFFIINALLAEKQANAEGSLVARVFDLYTSVDLFFRRPLWGWGYANIEVYKQFSANLLTERYNSNGLTSILYQLGVLGFLIYYIPFKRFYKTLLCNNDKRIFALFVLMIVMVLMGEPIQYNAIMIAMLAFFDAKFYVR